MKLLAKQPKFKCFSPKATEFVTVRNCRDQYHGLNRFAKVIAATYTHTCTCTQHQLPHLPWLDVQYNKLIDIVKFNLTI